MDPMPHKSSNFESWFNSNQYYNFKERLYINTYKLDNFKLFFKYTRYDIWRNSKDNSEISIQWVPYINSLL